jgi:hypothetical protein
MAKVTSKTANWRLFGGSAILAAGVLSLLALSTSLAWVQALSWIILAAGLIVVAFGQSGGNGAVGKYVLGKVALVLYAAGFVLLALNLAIPGGIPPFALVLAGLLVIVGGLVSAWAIERKSIAKGAAQWILFLPAIVGLVTFAGLVVPSLSSSAWILYLLAILFCVTGSLYLLNDRKLG